jgi:DNA-binding NtrC family response regulator
MRKPQAELIGSSDVIRDIADEIGRAARFDARVLITGEGGVGKNLAARMIHERSRRCQSTLTVVKCEGVPDSVLESELFGHPPRGVTGERRDNLCWLEQAQGGTIFLDEIGELSVHMQALLLRFLEDGQITGSNGVRVVADVRIIAASRSNLLAQIAADTFREDLFYRLNTFHIPIPPLRERRDDVATLFSSFVRSYCLQHRVPEPVISEEVVMRLVTYDWPGNVRELKNAAERTVAATRGVITEADLQLALECRGARR